MGLGKGSGQGGGKCGVHDECLCWESSTRLVMVPLLFTMFAILVVAGIVLFNVFPFASQGFYTSVCLMCLSGVLLITGIILCLARGGNKKNLCWEESTRRVMVPITYTFFALLILAGIVLCNLFDVGERGFYTGVCFIGLSVVALVAGIILNMGKACGGKVDTS